MPDLQKVENAMNARYGRKGNKAFRYYMEEKQAVPIFTREELSPIKQDSMVNVHAGFMKTIIEQKVGYVGDVSVYSNSEDLRLQNINEYMQSLDLFNGMETMMPETTRWTSIEGISHRLVYLKDGEPRLRNYHSWQVAYSGDDLFDPDAAYIFYNKEDVEGNIVYYVNVYDRENVTIHSRSSVHSEWNVISTEQHFFNGVPVVPFLNNEFAIGDLSPSTIHSIDVYDEVQSDVLSEIKASRFAYLLLFGELADIPQVDSQGQIMRDDDGNIIYMPQSEYLRTFRSMIFKTDDEGKPLGDARYLEKNMNDEVIEHNLDRLRSQIFLDASAVDDRDIIVGANVRTIAIKAAFDRLERKVETFIKYTNSAVRRQYELILGLALNNYIDLRLTQEDLEDWLATLQVSYNHTELIDPLDTARVHEINMRTMSYEDAFANNPLTNHAPKEFADRYKEQRESEVLLPDVEIR